MLKYKDPLDGLTVFAFRGLTGWCKLRVYIYIHERSFPKKIIKGGGIFVVVVTSRPGMVAMC